MPSNGSEQVQATVATEDRSLEAEWDDVTAELGLRHCLVLSQWKPRRRTFCDNTNVYKVELPRKAGSELPFESFYGSLRREFDILSACNDIAEVPLAIEYRTTAHYELAVYQFVDGRPAPAVDLSVRQVVHVLFRTARILCRISWRGIAHNDAHDQNVLIRPDGTVALIDFDQAVRTSVMSAFYRNFCPYLKGSEEGRHPWAEFAYELLSPRLPTWVWGCVRLPVRLLRAMARLCQKCKRLLAVRSGG